MPQLSGQSAEHTLEDLQNDPKFAKLVNKNKQGDSKNSKFENKKQSAMPSNGKNVFPSNGQKAGSASPMRDST